MEAPVERLPPQSLEAEQAVLGSMLIEREAIYRALELLDGGAFYRDAHRLIFEAIVALAERAEPVDVVTVGEELRRGGHLETVGGLSYLNTLASMVPTTANVEHYARIVADKAVLRRLIHTAGEIARRAFEGQEEVGEVLDAAERLIFNLAQGYRVRGYEQLKDVLVETFDHLGQLYGHKGQLTGLPTGFPDLDRLTAGLHPSDLFILAARPSQGKTAFSLNIACHVAVRKKKPVGIFSLEMSRQMLALRMLAAEARVDGQRLRSGELSEEEWKRLLRAFDRLSEAPIFIDDTPNIPLLELRGKARRMKAEHNVALLIVDYLQLIQGRARVENRQQEISEISRSLKALARELQVPLIALSQLSRAVEQRQDKRPLLSDLRESGSLEQDADLVAFIYHNPDLEDNVVELIVAKHRHGPTGSIRLCFLKETGLFGSLDRRFQEV